MEGATLLISEDKSSKKEVKTKAKKKSEEVKEEKVVRERKVVTVTEVAEVSEPLESVENELEVKKVSPEEIEEGMRELKPKEGRQILIGPPKITRFEKARIVGARALQLSLGAPSLVILPENIKDSIRLAEYELLQKALPISLRRILPNMQYQDIPITWLLD